MVGNRRFWRRRLLIAHAEPAITWRRFIDAMQKESKRLRHQVPALSANAEAPVRIGGNPVDPASNIGNTIATSNYTIYQTLPYSFYHAHSIQTSLNAIRLAARKKALVTSLYVQENFMFSLKRIDYLGITKASCKWITLEHSISPTSVVRTCASKC
jgi:hypothetical protein